MAKKEATPLSVMLGGGEDFYFDITQAKINSDGDPVFDEQGEPVFEVIATKKLKVLPLKLKEIDEFVADNVNIGPQFFTEINADEKAKTDKWLKTHVFMPGSGKVVTFDFLKEEGMDIVQISRLVRKLLDISG